MGVQERSNTKVGTIFQIVQFYISNQLSLEEARDQIGTEMRTIRPAQWEAVKVELGKWLSDTNHQSVVGKAWELFLPYLSPPYHTLPEGHPIRNYSEENTKARSILVKIDEMEGESLPLQEWEGIYEELSQFSIHIKRQEQNFYALIINAGFRSQVLKAIEYGQTILGEMRENRERLRQGNMMEFLIQQRYLTQTMMRYLDLEERGFFPKALHTYGDEEFLVLRRLDDSVGYSYIHPSANFLTTPFASTQKKATQPIQDQGKLLIGTLLPALLLNRALSIVTFSPQGEVQLALGDSIEEGDLWISENTIQLLLNGNKSIVRYWYHKAGQTVLITYSVIRNGLGKEQGILKTKEEVSDILSLTGEFLEEAENK